MTNEDTFGQRVALLQMLTGFWVPQIIATACRTGLLSSIAAGPDRDVAALATDLGLDTVRLAKLIAGAQTLGLVRIDALGLLTLTDAGRLLLPGVPGSLDGYARLVGARFYKAWGELERLMRGGPESGFELAFGHGLYSTEEAELQDAFYTAMRGFSMTCLPPLAAIFRAEAPRTLLDIGGGDGTVARALCAAVDGLSVTVLDRPGVADVTDPTDRVTFISGEITAPFPATYDAMLAFRVLHNLPDASLACLLGHARAALPLGGRFYIVDPQGGPQQALMDLNMMVLTGGRLRSDLEWQEIAATACLKLRSIRPLDTAHRLLTLAHYAPETRPERSAPRSLPR